MTEMRQNFVEFFSPGTMVAEITVMEITDWDIGKAKRMAKSISERYNATPYAFQFLTKSRGEQDLDSKVVKRSEVFFVHCKVQTLEQLVWRDDPKEEILRQNMEINGWDRIATTVTGWKWSQPMGERDVCLP